jgi:hypothetical protein
METSVASCEYVSKKVFDAVYRTNNDINVSRSHTNPKMTIAKDQFVIYNVLVPANLSPSPSYIT